jgi:glyoxylase-like metal-dependent hydrolase (beta-lactamase superfamily II)
MTDFYRYRVGEAVVTAFHEGGIRRPLDPGFVPNAPFEAVQAALAAAFLPTDALPITFTTLLVEIGGRRVLIDTGFGDSGPPSTGGTLRGLAAAGVARDAIDTVLISHMHGDHIIGLRLKDGTLAYPKARILVQEREWAHWTDPQKQAAAPEAAKAGFAAVERAIGGDAERFARYAWDEEVVPGIRAIAAPGHTPGHTAFEITSNGETLLVLSDVTNHPALFVANPGWVAAFDADPDETLATRARLLGRAADERLRVAFFHAPFPATGHVARTGTGFAFVPAQWGLD